MEQKFLIFSEFGELLDLSMELERKNVMQFVVADHGYKKIGENIVTFATHWWLRMGQNFTWIFDGCSNGKLQDWLRAQGENVFGGCEAGDKLENDRQLNQKWFKSLGYKISPSKNFTEFDSAITFVQANAGKLFIMKQNGDAPKGLNHKGKFKDGSDMVFHLTEMKKKWNEAEYGKVDFDLMEIVEGMEVAASAFFNGHDWMRDKTGKVVGFLNFEEKKEINGNLGETTGEMGTLFYGCTEDNELFRRIILRPGVADYLREIGFRGVFDINSIRLNDGTIIPLEPTCRPGIPSTSYEFIEALVDPAGTLAAVAAGFDAPVEIVPGFGMVMVIAAKPYPVEADIEQEASSMGEKLWILNQDKSQKEFSNSQRNHIHLENFCRDEEGNYRVATKNGYLLTVTSSGLSSISGTRKHLIDYIKENIYISGMKYRTDIGQRCEDYEDLIKQESTENIFTAAPLFVKAP
jgi:phosphoribosylamine--glycine ligase